MTVITKRSSCTTEAAVLILAPALKPAIVLLLQQQQQPKSTHTFLQNALLDNCFALLLLHFSSFILLVKTAAYIANTTAGAAASCS